MFQRFLTHLRALLAPRPSARRPHGALLEPLEDRIAPATFVNAHLVTYTDTDGDHVSVYSSKPIFTSGTASNLLKFNTGTVDGTSTPQQLQAIDLAGLGASVVGGDNISVTVQQAGGGDGFANVGIIESSFSLGKVVVQGDLGAILAGSNIPGSNHAMGLTSLNVHSMGGEGTTTQANGGSLLSAIYGAVGSITVQGDMVGTQFSVLSNTAGAQVNGTINSVKIGGALTGGSATLSGSITSSGNINSISIVGGLVGSIGQNSGSLQVGGRIGSITVGGVTGYTVANDTQGLGQGSGSIVTGNNIGTKTGIGSLTINGSLTGGDGSGSGYIGVTAPGDAAIAGGAFSNVKITGGLVGGSGNNSGQLNASSFGKVSIGTGIIGSAGLESGAITSTNGINSLTILSGGITGGTNNESGSVIVATAPTSASVIKSIVIHGDITGNASALSTITETGQINTGSAVDSITIYGSLIGSTAKTSGSVISQEHIGHITMLANGNADNGSITGGTGTSSGEITALSIGSVNIAGQLAGGGAVVNSGTNTGASSGEIVSTGTIGSITIGAGITGGAGAGSGAITTGTGYVSNLGSLKITSGGINGGVGVSSGIVQIGGRITSVNLNGTSITGGAGASSGALTATDSVGTISLGGLFSSTGSGSGLISVGGNLTSLTLTGVSASATTVSGVVDIAGSAGSISVHGNIVGAGDTTGLFEIGSAAKKIIVSGELDGGTGIDSGSIFAGLDDTSVISSITVSGGLVGGMGSGSGEVFAGGGITSGTFGDITGGSGPNSGSVTSDGALGAISISGMGSGASHGLIGGQGVGSGQINSGSTIKSINIHGSVLGGLGEGSGSIVSNSIFAETGDIQGDIGSITISGSIIGGANTTGSGANTGLISAAGNIKTITVGGNVTGTLESGTGGIIAGQQLIGVTGGDITTLTISGALQGVVVQSGEPETIAGSGYIEAGHIGTATIGSISAGSLGIATHVTNDGAILAANDIGSLNVTGGISGAYSNPVVISAVGQLTPGKTGDLALGKISVGGAVNYTNFLAGYDQGGNPVNGAASIGSVMIGGDWSGSNLVAAVIAGSNGFYGAASASLITSSVSVIPTIASVIIKGNVISATVPFAATDLPQTYGIVAEKVEALSINGVALDVKPGFINNLGSSDDAVMRNVLS